MLRSSFTPDLIEAGCDEVGRGCLAGPVVAAAVILPKNFQHERLNDSKQLTGHERELLQDEIKREALAWAVAEVSHTEIDEINILNASFLAMQRAVSQLRLKPELLLIDGNRFKTQEKIKFECIVKGDALYLSIAAASVLAKTYRDELMKKLDAQFPGYGWKTNVGYPTIAHRAGIKKLGITPYHRRSFNLLPSQTELFAG
ncbi:MAG: ribonuclease HII [Bacteroidetes bacterium]|nr:ribonuclease HII [Bacteroidota bacterium]MBS1539363.1 ribonuclease HII [Bacteroidota bacterium]